MQAQRFDIQKAPVPPLRAEARPAPVAQPLGVEATPGGLIRSTLLAGGAASAILIFFWLPAEYDIDPTGIGGLLGLTEMGAIKQQLYAEAQAQDAAAASAPTAPIEASTDPSVLERLTAIETQIAAIADVVGAIPSDELAAAVAKPVTAPPSEPAPEPVPTLTVDDAIAEALTTPPAAAEASGWREELVFTLAPAEAKEIKLDMAAGDVATFEWTATDGGVNYTQHGDDGGANEVRFEDGRASPGQVGTMTAPFSGKHGWFWRNRGDTPVTVTLRVGGAYAQLVEVKQP